MSRLACVWAPHLPAQLEQQRLRRPRQPLIVRQEGIVLDASEQVAAQGVQPGDPLAQALARAPEALLVEADLPRYRQAWDEALTALALHSPAVEDDSLGLAYIEAQGMGALYGDEGVWCRALRGALQEHPGLSALVGVASAKFTAWMAAQRSAPWRGYTLAEDDAAFLAPLAVDCLELPLEAQRRLRMLGIATLGDLARLPANAVAEQFGPECLTAHRRAAGRDDRPLQGRRRQLLTARHAFELPEARGEALLALLQRLGQRLFAELNEAHLVARRLQVRFELAGGESWSKSAWASEGLGPQRLQGLLAGLLRELQRAHRDDEGVLAIELQLTALEATDGRQLQLFAQMEDRYRLAEALDRLAHKHPGDSVLQAQPHLPDDELVAERYRLRRR